MDPEKIIDGLFDELDALITKMSKAKTADEKLAYSQAIKNLSESLANIIDIINEMIDCECECEEDEEE